jgi:hypothetical protein
MARAHAVAAVIKEATDQQTLGFGPFGLMVVDVFIQLGLDGLEEVRLVGGLFGVASVFGNCSVIDISGKFASQRTKGHLARIGYMRPRHSENCVHGPCFVDGATA